MFHGPALKWHGKCGSRGWDHTIWMTRPKESLGIILKVWSHDQDYLPAKMTDIQMFSCQVSALHCCGRPWVVEGHEAVGAADTVVALTVQIDWKSGVDRLEPWTSEK